METDFSSFHEDAQFSTNSLLLGEEMMKDHLGTLENVKTEDNYVWPLEFTMNEPVVVKEDFQQIMSDWQNHVGSLQVSEPEDVPLDLLSTTDLFDERSPILSKSLNSAQKLESILQPSLDVLGIKQEPDLKYDHCDSYLRNQSNDIFYNTSPVKSEPTIVRKWTLLSGEKDILGKNIIGLHSLNEIKENPDENCQVTSTVINGKKYRVIIKPKSSQKLKKYTGDRLRKTLIKKLSKSNVVPKVEQKEDEIISEMRNGNYDVPILGNDTLLSWDMALCDTTWDDMSENGFSDIITVKAETKTEASLKVPPLKIKLPKNKKLKKVKPELKSDDEIDVETVCDKVSEHQKSEISCESNEIAKVDFTQDGDVESTNLTSNENIKNSLPRNMVAQIESLKRKKDGRIPLIQVIPVQRMLRSGTRMHDAAATITRNKLLKIVSSGETVQLDHDYCTNTVKRVASSPQKNMETDFDINLSEKNPKKDSGMESGDVSDASEEPQVPESWNNLRSIQEINNKLVEERKNGKASTITKVAAAFFRATNLIASNTNVNNSDAVKTLVVSNGNKALTNSSSHICNYNGDQSDIVPSGSEISNSNNVDFKAYVTEENKSNVSCNENTSINQNDRPKKKLKLEEYLSRRNGEIVRSRQDSFKCSEDKSDTSKDIEALQEEKPSNKNFYESTKEEVNGNVKELEREKEDSQEIGKEKNSGNKSRQYRSRRSSSTSSGERDIRKDKERSSRSRSSWKGSRRDSWSRHKYRTSTSRDRRHNFWSRRSFSRSSSRESSSSSDRSGGRRKRTGSPVWYHRRSRSRSISRERSRSRNRSYSNRRRQNRYFNRNFCNRRSRSPVLRYSLREKQRQIEERRVVYIGRIEEGMTNAKLRDRFSSFGPIVDISLHFREYGDNYGFVTYAYKDDAYDAVEHGNDDPNLPHYDLCFGGRRGFCKERYADLDGMPQSYSGFKDNPLLRSSEESFDLLLKKAQAKLKSRMSKNKT